MYGRPVGWDGGRPYRHIKKTEVLYTGFMQAREFEIFEHIFYSNTYSALDGWRLGWSRVEPFIPKTVWSISLFSLFISLALAVFSKYILCWKNVTFLFGSKRVNTQRCTKCTMRVCRRVRLQNVTLNSTYTLAAWSYPQTVV